MTRPPLHILARGDGWVVVAKPPRLVVHRNAHMPKAHAAVQQVRDLVGAHVHPIHRLDAAASGCLLFATDAALAGPLSVALAAGEKTYVALVRGVCKGPPSVVVDRPLKDDNGLLKEARSALLCVASTPEPRCSLVRAMPETGRFHQIRRHLAGISHPIVGDVGHGDRHTNRWWREQRGLDRLALHALSLSLDLPGGGRLEVNCPLFEDMARVLRALPLWSDAVAALPALDAAPLSLGGAVVRPQAQAEPGRGPRP